jgi:uncharacterized protein (TIGR02145 family)
MKKKTRNLISPFILLAIVFTLANGCKKEETTDNRPTITDIDGNVYHTVTIGTQTWTVENLRTTKYSDGVSIPNVSDDNTWNFLDSGAYCDYNNTPSNAAKYGRLYNWFAAVSTHNLAPAGWHVATDADWATLTAYLGGDNIAGGKLKEAGTGNWSSPNTGATNETGFTAIPAGYRNLDGSFSPVGAVAQWWCASEFSLGRGLYRSMTYDGNNVSGGNYIKSSGFSIRCVKD